MNIKVGQKVKDTKSEYKNDIGKIDGVVDTRKGKYVTIEWGENTIHGDGTYGRYKPEKFGMFKRFRSV